MRIKLTRTKVATSTEYLLEIERNESLADRARWASEDAHRAKMALEAISEAPTEAADIAGRALEELGDL